MASKLSSRKNKLWGNMYSMCAGTFPNLCTPGGGLLTRPRTDQPILKHPHQIADAPAHGTFHISNPKRCRYLTVR